LLRFGAGVSVANLLYYFSGNADNILVGRFLGQVPLGLYSRAYNLFLVPLRQLHGPLGNVVQPVMSAIVSEPERYRRFYCRILSAVVLIGMSGVVFLAVMSRQVIVVVLGSRWLGAAEPFRWLAVAGFFALISRTFAWLFTTSGRSRAMAISAAVSTPLIVGSFAIGLHWGITGVAESYAIVQTALIVPSIWYATHETSVTMRDVLSSTWRPTVVAAWVGSVVWLIRDLTGTASAVSTLIAAGAAGMLCWGAMVWFWPTVREEVKGMRLIAGRQAP
jgi:O-antigen/teichoic acid export membrane protein